MPMPNETAYTGGNARMNSTPTTSPAGSQLRRRYMPAVGGMAGPAASAPKPAGGGYGTGTLGTSASPSSTPAPGYNFGGKGGGAYFPNGGGTSSAPWMQHGVPSHARMRPPMTPSPIYGGFNPAQMTQQNGQWGMQGRGGNFQALGANALQRWLAQQGGQPQPAQPAQPAQPSGPPMAQGYVTPQQWEQWSQSGINDWFRNSQPQGANDWNAFNNWFRDFGRSADPTAWDRLYGQPTTNPNETAWTPS